MGTRGQRWVESDDSMISQTLPWALKHVVNGSLNIVVIVLEEVVEEVN